jgi:hypothetical protein
VILVQNTQISKCREKRKISKNMKKQRNWVVLKQDYVIGMCFSTDVAAPSGRKLVAREPHGVVERL